MFWLLPVYYCHSVRLKVLKSLNSSEIMSGDLLEDLMSSEGESVYKMLIECIMCVNTFQHLWLNFIYPARFNSFLCLFDLQCSRLSCVCPLRPATTTTYTTWMRQKACVTSLTSPFSTSDPCDCCQSGKQFPNCANLPSFSPKNPPHTHTYIHTHTHSPHWLWRREEVQKGQYDLMSFKDTSALTQWSQAELSQTALDVQPRDEIQARTKHFTYCFSKRHTQDKWGIIIFLDCYVW